jgi:hypothetical protein
MLRNVAWCSFTRHRDAASTIMSHILRSRSGSMSGLSPAHHCHTASSGDTRQSSSTRRKASSSAVSCGVQPNLSTSSKSPSTATVPSWLCLPFVDSPSFEAPLLPSAGRFLVALALRVAEVSGVCNGERPVRVCRVFRHTVAASPTSIVSASGDTQCTHSQQRR